MTTLPVETEARSPDLQGVSGGLVSPEGANEPCPPDFLIQVQNLVKIYNAGGVELRALDGVSFSIARGEFVAVMGPSGSGKSTMMNMLGCLDSPTEGSYFLDGRDVSKLSGDDLAEVRNRKLGFVFQGFNLLPRATALENVALPLVYAGVPLKERRERAKEALSRVGLADRLEHRPSQMSGGQQQRVAIARALVCKAPLILADEPTGNLDTQTSMEIMNLLTELNREGKTIVLVTHEPDIATYAKRTLHFKDGRAGRAVGPAPVMGAVEARDHAARWAGKGA